uniref:Uncharacterized protein n=1 Tax=Tanacetum cinerariifolium TaxID=118510 RepID=A0A6L2LMD6_TANCI|nr:hypothetical protein [Tanacetum cinerariifolium]
MQVDMKGLLNAITVKVNDIWLGNALSLSDHRMQHDPMIPNGQAVQTIIPNNVAFQTEDLDAYDSDCDDISNAKAILMANISNYGSNFISEDESVNMERKRNKSCDECFNLEVELLKSQNAHNDLLKRLKCSTSNYGSKPTSNKKNDRISQTPCKNIKNKVEAQSRKVNKKNYVVEPSHDDDVKHLLLNAIFVCATCCLDCSLVSGLWMFKPHDREPLSAHELFLVAAAPRAVDLLNSLVSTSIDQDAPLTSIPSTQEQQQSQIISQGFEESPKTPIFYDDPLYESLHENLTSQGSSSNSLLICNGFDHSCFVILIMSLRLLTLSSWDLYLASSP